MPPGSGVVVWFRLGKSGPHKVLAGPARNRHLPFLDKRFNAISRGNGVPCGIPRSTGPRSSVPLPRKES